MWPELRKQMSTPDATTPAHVARPRPRPEAARRNNDSALQHPPNRHSVATSNGRTHAREGDLISWSLANPTAESAGRGGLFDMSALNALYERPNQPPPGGVSPLPRTVFPVVTSDNQLMYPSPSPAHRRSDAFGMPILVTPGDAADAFLSMPQYNAGQAAFSPKEKLSLSTVERELDSTFPDRMVKSQSWTGGRPRSDCYNSTNEKIWTKSALASNNNNNSLAQSNSSIKASQSDFSLRSYSTLATPLKKEGELIDLGHDYHANCLTKVSVLEAFDPLLVDEDFPRKQQDVNEESSFEADSSFYESYDPFEYMTAQAERHDVFEEVQGGASPPMPTQQQFIKKHSRQPSVPESVDLETLQRRQKQKADYELVVRLQTDDAAEANNSRPLFSCLGLNKERDVAVDKEIEAFTQSVAELRATFHFDDPKTNPGAVVCAKIESAYPAATSVKLVVHSPQAAAPIAFTCDVNTGIQHIIVNVLCDLEGDLKGETEEFVLQVAGTLEYLEPNSQLRDYEYVHQCYKYDRDLEFVLVSRANLKMPYLRTVQDDKTDCDIRIEDISPKDQMRTLSYDDLNILLDTLFSEVERMKTVVKQLAECSDREVMSVLRPKQSLVSQAVKMVCALLGSIETLEIEEICDQLCKQCLAFDKVKASEDPNKMSRPEFSNETGDRYVSVMLPPSHKPAGDYADAIVNTLCKIPEVVQKLIEVYAKTFRVNFSFTASKSQTAAPKEAIEVQETLLLRVCSLHRLGADWTFESFAVTMQIYHGTRPLAEAVITEFVYKSDSFYERVKFDKWMETKSVRICSLPREARLVFTVFGLEVIDTKENKRRTVKTEIGWCSLQLYNFERFLAQGTFLLPLWPPQVEKQVGPAPDSGSHPAANTCPVLSIELPELVSPVIFPDKIPIQPASRMDFNFNDLDFETQQDLLDSCELDLLTFNQQRPEKRERLWEKRYYLRNIPGALPKVLLAAHSWEYACLPSLYGLLHSWKRPHPMDILQLFLPCFPDSTVRECAIDWISDINSDEMLDYLPQLLEALKHETWSVSPLAKLLLQRSMTSPRVAHCFYWLLTQSLPGMTPQNTSCDLPDIQIRVARYRRRLQMLMRALYTISGAAMRASFCKQQELLKLLNEAALQVQAAKDSSRPFINGRNLDNIHQHLRMTPTAIPLSPSIIANGINVQNSSYFPSNTVPLKILFTTVDQSGALPESSSKQSLCSPIPVIFKVGDDLRQDMLTIQMIRVMDKLWLKENLDLKMVTFSCVPTGDKQGMMEMVTDAKTLREIQVMGSRGVTGSFKDTPIYEWLEKHNPSQLEFARAVQNFTRSCAGYSIATYILGVCDRHNDNIMVKTSGHLFHIDFGKFLGDSQMFGNFKRDRSPFVLTPDMVYVINGGDKPTQRFHDFVDLCCKGFNIIRKHGNLLLNLFSLMASSGIPGVSMDSVSYVQRALLSDLSSSEAAAHFSKMIEESLSSWFTQWNFFIHNIGQMRFTGETTDGVAGGGGGGELLSFIPKRYSLKSDGRLTTVQVFDIQKRYSPEKHYVFILKIERAGVRDPTFLFRTYKEFCEFESKLRSDFQMAPCYSLRKGFNLGRQEVREVAERRKQDIGLFLDSLFSAPDTVAHSDIVYTFFHPLLRDQEEANVHIKKLRENKGQSRNSSVGRIKGELKLTLEYRRGLFCVMVCHAKNLAIPDGSKEEPNSYVKVYLHPDPQKVTKRKTRVVRKNCHPSFMEMLEYRLPLERVQTRTLRATVWDCDRFQENLFLGAVTIPLENVDFGKECTRWYKLESFQRLS